MSFDLAPWKPYARVMWDYFTGKHDASIVVYDDFERDEAPIAYFFRDPSQFSPIDQKAVEACRGRVLDVGAGSGCHSLALQERGVEVVALETLPELAEILQRRGVRQVHRGSIHNFAEGSFDTVMMMMNGIGIAETIEGLGALLDHIRGLLRPGGQLLADSCDIRIWDVAGRPDEKHLTRPDGRYLGELHFQLEYEGEKGPPFQQLYVDPNTLAKVAARAGWQTEIVLELAPAYLARLTPNPKEAREERKG
ncbi:MAG: class I SAM-dependent methyltransferase [Gemmatimonadetes bacterium]|nr:class I SAM-dependent methyltransferase [Gemmatimonadota bacterium]